MKKLVFLFVAACLCATMNAQTKDDSGVLGEISLGGYGHDAVGDGLAIDLGVGYRKAYTQYFAWDILKVKAMTELNNFSDFLAFQGITTARGTTPVLFSNITGFGSFGAGYGYFTELETGGFVYEFQAGLNITPSLSVGIVYLNQKMKDVNVTIFDYKFRYSPNISFTGIRLGYRF